MPSTFYGAVVALADKLDTIASFFSIDVIPTGSQDPYGLRRQASGIVSILIDRNWGISFKELLSLTETEKENELLDFFTQRLKYVLNAEDIRHDVIEAVLDSTELEPYAAVHKARVLEKHLGTPGFKETAESLGRVISISKKARAAISSRICLKMNRRKSCLTLMKKQKTVSRKALPPKTMNRRLPCSAD